MKKEEGEKVEMEDDYFTKEEDAYNKNSFKV